MSELRRGVGRAGERVAAWFLLRNGVRVVAHNVRVGRGEVDLIARDGSTQLVVEVRSRMSRKAPIEAFDIVKQQQLRSLSNELGIGRVDLVAVGFGERFVAIHWIPFVV